MARSHSRTTLRVVAGAVLVALALGGCGSTGDRDDARGAVERFYAALQQHDGAGACGQLSSDLVKQLEQDEKKACPAAVTGLGLKPGAVTRVEVFLTNAKIDVTGGEAAFLDRGPEGWQLSAIGCKPESKPADHPYDCEAEA